MKIEDTLWGVLDALHLGEFFDSHNIPPIAFPIALIAVIALLLLILSPGGGAGGCNNDGMCSPPENSTNCPNDCQALPPETGKTVTVSVSGGLYCNSIHIALKDSSGTTLGSAELTSSTRSKKFPDIAARSAYAEASSAQSTKDAVESDPIDTSAKSTIKITLDADYCPQAAAPPPAKGSISVTLTNLQSSQPVTAQVSLFDGDNTLITEKSMTGSGAFTNLEANTYYYLNAIASGFRDYNGASETHIYVQANLESAKNIIMQPLAAPITPGGPNNTGELEVCVTGDGPVEADGEIAIYDVSGQMIKTISIGDCPLQTGSANKRCGTFKLPREKVVYASVRRAPSGCAISEKVGPVTIGPEKEFLSIELACNLIGEIKARVMGNSSEVLTDLCTVELYKIKSNDDVVKVATMNLSDDGEWTEPVELAAETKVYVYAKNPPEGYIPTKSSTKTIKAGKTLNVTVVLDTPPPLLPNLTLVNPSISKTVLSPGQAFTIKVDAVKLEYQGPDLLPTDGVAVQCKTSWGTTKNAVYDATAKWRCINITAPAAVGQKTVTVVATKARAAPASHQFSLAVVSESTLPLNITFIRKDVTGAQVTLYFNISRIVSGIKTPVQDLESGSVVRIFFVTGNELRAIGDFALSKVQAGYFNAVFQAPFRGDYTYVANASTVIGSTRYRGILNGGNFLILIPAKASISCSVEPELTSTGGSFNVTATLTLNGRLLPNQRLRASITDADETRTAGMVWSEADKIYRKEFTTMGDECSYLINCSSVDDPTVFAITNVSAVYSAGANPLNCRLDSPQMCKSLQNLRDCYGACVADPSYCDAAAACARQGLGSCSGPPPSTGCYQAMKLKVRGISTAKTNTTPRFLFYRIAGTSTMAMTALPAYPLPLNPGSGVIYKMVDITIPGGTNPGVRESPSFSSSIATITINPSTGNLSAWAGCDVACGAPGDLNSDGQVNGNDIPYMQEVMTTISMLGENPYPLGSGCFDFNSDGHVTVDDLNCLSMVVGGASISECTRCVPDNRTWNPAHLEICHDGEDNDCDGQIDADTYDNAKRDYYNFTNKGPFVESLCGCTSKTPCTMLYSNSGLSLGEAPSEGDVKRCVSLNGGAYGWADSSIWQCNSARNGGELMCGGNTRYVCQQLSGQWQWARTNYATYPQNPLVGGGGGNYHYECDTVNQVCKQVAGSGRSNCTPSTYWGECAHRVCDDASKTCRAVSGRGEDECVGTYWGYCAHTTCNDFTHTCSVVNEPGANQCELSPGKTPGDVYWDTCPYKHYECNDAARSCQLITDTLVTKGTPSECNGTYWGNCAFRTCSDTGCTIIEGVGPDACSSNYNCTWTKSGSESNRASYAYCPPNTAIANFAKVWQGYMAYCLKLPPGVSLGPSSFTADGRDPYCGSGSVAIGIDCTGGCNTDNMRLQCAELRNATKGESKTSGVIALGSFQCNSLFGASVDAHHSAFLTELQCVGSAGNSNSCSLNTKKVTCQLLSASTTTVR